MSIIYLLRIVLAKLKYIIVISVTLGVTTFYLLKDTPKSYASKASMYTGVTSGFSLLGAADLSYNQSKSAYDNIIQILKSHETHKTVGLFLIAQHIKQGTPDKYVILEGHRQELLARLPKNYNELIDTSKTIPELAKQIRKVAKTKEGFELARISNSGYYSAGTIAKNVQIKRIGNSDIINLEYTSLDPGICHHTLLFLIDVFKEKFQDIKFNEARSAVKYFEDEIAKTVKKLSRVEDKLTRFRKQNNIINYEQETRYVSAQKEIMEDYYIRTKMDLRAAVYQAEELESELNIKEEVVNKTTAVLNSNEVLSKLYADIAKAKIFQQNPEKINELKFKADSIKDSMTSSLDDLYVTTHGKSGLSIKTVLEEWLGTKMKIKEFEGKIDGIEYARVYYGNKYKEFAPLGSQLDRINREIETYEGEYRELYRGLSDAKIQERNVQMSSSFNIVDPPIYPTKPAASKVMLMVIMAGFAGFIMPILVMIILEFLDSSIKTVERATRFTGFKVAGVFASEKAVKSKDILNEKLNAVSSGKLLQELRLKYVEDDNHSKKPKLISITSMKPSEGKTYVIAHLIHELLKLKKSIALITTNKDVEIEGVDVYKYHADEEFANKQSINDIIGLEMFETNNYDFTIMEFPSMIINQIPAILINDADENILVVNASRSWNKSDDNTMESIRSVIDKKTIVALNEMEIIHIETLIGDIPRKRSKIRTAIKDILTLQFKKTKSFS